MRKSFSHFAEYPVKTNSDLYIAVTYKNTEEVSIYKYIYIVCMYVFVIKILLISTNFNYKKIYAQKSYYNIYFL